MVYMLEETGNSHTRTLASEHVRIWEHGEAWQRICLKLN